MSFAGEVFLGTWLFPGRCCIRWCCPLRSDMVLHKELYIKAYTNDNLLIL